jgi:hypothetical protein
VPHHLAQLNGFDVGWPFEIAGVWGFNSKATIIFYKLVSLILCWVLIPTTGLVGFTEFSGLYRTIVDKIRG